MITVSAPGKVFLMGEHAVVYGRPALLAAINKRLFVSVEEAVHDMYDARLAPLIQDVRALLKISNPLPIRLTIISELNEGYHLGSSAAIAAAVSGALLYFYKKIWNPIRINEMAYELEKKHHGTPSGADNTTVVMGGFVWYRKELEFLRSMWQLPMRSSLDRFYLIDTGRPKETTKEMVAFVRGQKGLDTYFNENEKQTKRVATALKTNDETLLIDAMRKGEQTLESMGVVSEFAKKIIRQIEIDGGAAKILGGGGKAEGVGYILCYGEHTSKDTLPIRLGEEGIRLEKKQ